MYKKELFEEPETKEMFEEPETKEETKEMFEEPETKEEVQGLDDEEMNIEPKEVQGLGDEEMRILYFKTSSGKTVFKVNSKEYKYSNYLLTAVEKDVNSGDDEKNPLIIPNIKYGDNNIEFVVKYMRMCAEKNCESKEPAKPLIKKPLPEILGSEYIMFKSLLEDDSKSDSRKIRDLSYYLETSTYFGMQILMEKCAAVMSTLFTGKSMDELNLMKDEMSEMKQ